LSFISYLDADKRQQVEKILNEELPQTLTIVDLNINKCQMKKRAIQSDVRRLIHWKISQTLPGLTALVAIHSQLDQIARERRKIVASYLKTFRLGESPESDGLPSELLFETDNSSQKDRLEGEDDIWGDNDSDLEISDSDLEDDDEVLQMAADDDDDDVALKRAEEDEGQKSTPLASRKV
jgi:hypothetical protein